MSTTFELPVDVRPEHIDALGHVNNIVYLQWVQEVAGAHWRHVASAEMLQDVAWIVLRHEIDYKQAAMPGDSLLVRTWVGAARGLSFERHTEILRNGDGLRLTIARTIWCPIDPSTGRPRRVTPEVRALMSSDG